MTSDASRSAARHEYMTRAVIGQMFAEFSPQPWELIEQQRIHVQFGRWIRHWRLRRLEERRLFLEDQRCQRGHHRVRRCRLCGKELRRHRGDHLRCQLAAQLAAKRAAGAHPPCAHPGCKAFAFPGSNVGAVSQLLCVSHRKQWDAMNRRVVFRGVEASLIDLAKAAGLAWDIVKNRLERGWTLEQTIATPKGQRPIKEPA